MFSLFRRNNIRVEGKTFSPITLAGEIVHGKGEGHKYGIPTINLKIEEGTILPEEGVYASRSTINGETYLGVTNIGKRPSADNMDYVSVETFLLDFDKDVYGKVEILELIQYLRPIKKFEGGLEELKEQIKKDAKEAERLLKKELR